MRLEILSRSQLPLEQYLTLLRSEQCPLIYFEPWFLDIVTQGNWVVLTDEKRHFFMPIPYARLKRHFFIKRIVQPPFTQRLGLIGKCTVDVEPFFMNLKPYCYSFKDQPKKIEVQTRVNYTLICDKPYVDLHRNYHTNLKRNLKKAVNYALEIKISEDVSHFVNFYQKYNPSPLNKRLKLIQIELIRESLKRGKGFIISASSASGEELGSVFFLKSGNHLVYLFSATTPRGKKTSAIPYILDYLIKKYAKTSTLLDFEGSQIPGVARFFKMFGAENCPYFLYKS